MNPQLYKDILLHFDFKTMEVLERYIEDRLTVLRYATESLQADDKTIRFAQGAIDELKILKKIRDTALKVEG